MQQYNFACCCVWVCNLVSDLKGRTWIADFREEGAEEGKWT